MTNKKLLKMAIEIVDLPMKNGDFPIKNVSLPEGKHRKALIQLRMTRFPVINHTLFQHHQQTQFCPTNQQGAVFYCFLMC